MAKVIKKNVKSTGVELDTRNYIIFGIGVLMIVLGYVIMATGETYSFQSLTVAPLVLLIGYLVIIPIAILIGPNPNPLHSLTVKNKSKRQTAFTHQTKARRFFRFLRK